ncbi:MarR family winged helix-turn-helix transcriptional regulator [Spirosoma utsteinense]|uniref:DNA-binding MarR family transcriptional regulator n=1 Tax=Spirosoma utsteinense TaxID=2585773 RepID=A0ABR6W7F4_9BACT|nr:MarR family transcriptional regulator [Spirosoma utsteinense]MBC3788718.1 DNA-binding MarR family transcriptional regulator [Spirosoma utsteinense]MBC3792511.1 DNA-binding MarR family transcriptional regulator [Spirosoma utsteinense]
MSIEADIKQTTPFKTPYHRVMVNLMYTSNWVADSQMRVLKPFGLTLQQYNVLRILRGQHPNPVKVSDITERMLDKMSNASRLVDKLVAKKLVLRTECPSDRRAVDVVITDQGLALLKRLDTHQAKWDLTQADKLTEEEANYLSQLLDRLRA